ncbi:hypothetical protein [Gordonia sp. DT101]|uniref:hypothetical protein n=1 Tax=Gordonia sp. DT101 TaxID=3416545 RepID=UPI003CF3C104
MTNRLYELAIDIRDSYQHLRPTKRGPEVSTSKPAPGPRDPIPAYVLDVEIATERTVRAIVSEQMAAHPGLPRPASRDVHHLTTWLLNHSGVIVQGMDPGDIRDLEIVAARCDRLARSNTGETDRDVRLAQMRQRAGLGADHWTTSRRIVSLAKAAGVDISRTTVRNWGTAGRIRTQKVGEETHYSLGDVLRETRQEELTANDLAPDSGHSAAA